MGQIRGVGIHELSVGGFGLVFGSFPVALSTLPGGNHWIRVFYLMLFLLGIDSAFSFMDACLVSFNDSGGFGLVFGSFPAVLNTVPGGENCLSFFISWLFCQDFDCLEDRLFSPCAMAIVS